MNASGFGDVQWCICELVRDIDGRSGRHEWMPGPISRSNRLETSEARLPMRQADIPCCGKAGGSDKKRHIPTLLVEAIALLAQVETTVLSRGERFNLLMYIEK